MNLKVSRAWAIKEMLRKLWHFLSSEAAWRFWKRWYFWAPHSRLAPIRKAAKTIKDHIANIMTYFHQIAWKATKTAASSLLSMPFIAAGMMTAPFFPLLSLGLVTTGLAVAGAVHAGLNARSAEVFNESPDQRGVTRGLLKRFFADSRPVRFDVHKPAPTRANSFQSALQKNRPHVLPLSEPVENEATVLKILLAPGLVRDATGRQIRQLKNTLSFKLNA